MDEFETAVNETLASIRAHPHDQYAHEIGRVCMLWSRLELGVALLLAEVMGIQDATTKNVILGELDVRAKIRVMLPIAFAKKKTDAWFEALTTELNEIDNDLRNERNRIIHDYWTDMPGSGVNRVQIVGKVVKNQRDKKLVLANYKPVSLSDLMTLQVRLAKAMGAVDLLREEFAPQPFPYRPLPPIPPGNPSQGQNPKVE